MFSQAFRDDAKHVWGDAASPSPAAALGRHRTPRDDAPVYEPLMWKDTDSAYISTLAAHLMTHQPAASPSFDPAGRSPATKPPLEKFLSSSWKCTPEEEAAARLSKFHAVYNRRPTTVMGRALQYISSRLFWWWHEDVWPADVEALPTRDLIHLMQLAVAAGETDRSAMLAYELSRRKLALQMETIPSTSVGTARYNESRASGLDSGAAPHLPASPVPQPVPATIYGGFLPQPHSQPPLSPQASPWGGRAGPASARPSWTPQPQTDRVAPMNDDYLGARRSASVDRTALWNEESLSRPPARSPGLAAWGGDASPNVSDIGVSSLRGSEGGSQWQSPPSWSRQWSHSPAQNS